MVTATITFHLTGPQQSWSAHERRATRPTQNHPTKSGVIGLIANALGRDRADDIADLAALQFAVRADRPGIIESDYHTSGSGTFPLLPAEVIADPELTRAAAKGRTLDRAYAAPKNVRRDAKGNLVGKRSTAVITTDHYLADAAFTIALTGPRLLIERIAAALTTPARSLHLGRKAYPLSAPPAPTVHLAEDPAELLATTGRGTMWVEEPAGRRRLDAETRLVADQPVHFGTRNTVARLERRRDVPPATTGSVDMFTPEDPT